MSSEGKRALITGVRGFTGLYLADELRRHGYEVFGLGNAPADGDGRYAQVDINDLSALSSWLGRIRPQVIIHLAALAFVGYGNANEFYRVNLLGTRNLLEAASSLTPLPECVLVASSANVYGNSTLEILAEDMPVMPANDYAVSKLAMEYMARLWADRLPLIITRPFNYTGVGQAEQFLIPKIVSHFRQRMDRIELGNLDVSRDFSDVRTVVHLYRRLVEQPDAIGKIVNVCSGLTHSLREVVDMCELITGHEVRIDVNPAFIRGNEVRTLCGDNALLRKLVGDWDAPPLAETLRWMLG